MKVKAVKVNRAHYFLTDPRICTVILIMMRNYTRKTKRGIAKPDEMFTAVRHIKNIEIPSSSTH